MVAVAAASALVLSLMPAGAVAQAGSLWSNSAYEADSQSGWWGYFDPVDDAVEVLQAHEWVAAPGMAPNAKACKAWLEQELASLDLDQVQVRLNEASLNYIAPVDGTAEDPAGTPGSFTMEIYVYRSWLDVLGARHVTIGGTLEAAAYQPPVGEGGSDEPAEPEPTPGPGDPGASPEQPDPGTEGGSDVEPGGEPSAPDAPDVPEPPQKDPAVPVPPVVDKPAAPATVEEAAQVVQQVLAQQVAADAAALTIGEDDLQEASFEDESSAKEAVLQWVGSLLDKEGVIPEGYSYQLGEPEVELPTATEAGSFKCPVYLEEEDTGALHPLSVDAPVQPQPLAEAARTSDVGAVIGEQGGSHTSRTPDLYVEGVIAPRVLKAADDGNGDSDGSGADGSGSSDGAAQQPGTTPIHPLAIPNTAEGIDIINSEEQLEGEGAPRPIKRPDQISGQERQSSVSSTADAVQHGSTIASTDDPMAPLSRLAAGLVFASLIASMICLRRLRKSNP